MTTGDFIKWASDCEKRYGSRPRSVTLNKDDVNDLYDDLCDGASGSAVYAAPGSPAAQRVAHASARRPGYCLTLAGVDVYRDGAVKRGEFRLD